MMGIQHQPTDNMLPSHLASHGSGWQLSLLYQPLCQVAHIACPALCSKHLAEEIVVSFPSNRGFQEKRDKWVDLDDLLQRV